MFSLRRKGEGILIGGKSGDVQTIGSFNENTRCIVGRRNYSSRKPQYPLDGFPELYPADNDTRSHAEISLD